MNNCRWQNLQAVANFGNNGDLSCVVISRPIYGWFLKLKLASFKRDILSNRYALDGYISKISLNDWDWG